MQGEVITLPCLLECKQFILISDRTICKRSQLILEHQHLTFLNGKAVPNQYRLAGLEKYRTKALFRTVTKAIWHNALNMSAQISRMTQWDPSLITKLDLR